MNCAASLPNPRDDDASDIDRDQAESSAAHQRLADICRGLSVGPAIAVNFIDDYLRMLTERIDRIDRDLSVADREEAVVALLSLDSSSTMLGAYELSEIAQKLRIDIERDSSAVYRADTTDLHREADRARTELAAVRDHVEQHH